MVNARCRVPRAGGLHMEPQSKTTTADDGINTFTGSCMCGSVRYEIRRPSLDALDCHCTMCRKLHAADYATYLMAWPEEVTWNGEGNLTTYQSSANGVREFCKDCGTIMRARGQAGDGREEIPAGSLDNDPPIRLVGHIFTHEKSQNYEICKPGRRY